MNNLLFRFRGMSEKVKSRIAIFYIVIDLSGSMAECLNALQTALSKLLDNLRGDPIVSRMCWLSVIGFGSQAKTLLPLCDSAREMEEPPLLQIMGSTEYLSAFNELNARIAEDIKTLKLEYEVTRPNIVFLTDGNPTDKSDEWLNVRNQMLERSWRPNILSFGYGSVTEQTLHSIATEVKGSNPLRKHAYIDTAVEPPEVMLIELFESLTATIINIAGSVAMGQSMQVYTPANSMKQIEIDVIDVV
jgi:uncharacterized protein YegL